MAWRRTLFSLHRDVGYLCAGLVLVYAVSGVAVNHRHDWNYNQSRSIEVREVGRADALLGASGPGAPDRCLSLAREGKDRLAQEVARRLGRRAPRKVFWRGPSRLSLFFGEGEKEVADYDPVSGRVELLVQRDRPVLRQLNALHLNEPGAAWTWIADLFAVALAFLAISGLLMVRGQHGLRGRRILFFAIGLALPVLGLVLRCQRGRASISGGA